MDHTSPTNHNDHQSQHVPVTGDRAAQNDMKAAFDFLIPASILLSGILISGSIFYATVRPAGQAAQGFTEPDPSLAAAGEADGALPPISDRDVVLGDPNAPVTVIEYGDFQCPFCARFHNDVGLKIREEYVKSGKVKMVFRNFQFLGPESLAAAEAAECAKDQGKYWPFHDAIYNEELRDGQEHNGNLNNDFFLKTARSIGMDVAEFSSCFDNKKYASKVQTDTADGQSIGVNSTPTSFVNGQKVPGALPWAQFKALIDSQLAAN